LLSLTQNPLFHLDRSNLMALEKNYKPAEIEPRLDSFWQENNLYHFDRSGTGPVYSIDTPPPTVSGNLHLGHVYSYSHADFMARYQRMRGKRVYYPMGFDDNGLPTERLVEKRFGITAAGVGREAFIRKCLEVSEEAEKEYRALWQRLGLSIDWRYTYRTIDRAARRISQLSFLHLLRAGLAYRRAAPAIWCPECRTAVAQAELDDLERQTEFVTIPFILEDGKSLPVATTRPELLAACVAVFVHPADMRYMHLIGQEVITPYFAQRIPVIADAGADPEKGTGAVMCCTFGDQTDMAWWHKHHLPLIEAIDTGGKMTAVAGPLVGMSVGEARKEIKRRLDAAGLILERKATAQSVRVHERCDTPVEIVMSAQWFIRLLDRKERLLELGEQVRWHPEGMGGRYRAWVEGLSWDWALSRQRVFGVPFPVWICRACGAVTAAEEADLPLDPAAASPARPCACGGTDFAPDLDVMDTWATSALSPQIAGRWLEDKDLYSQVAPFSLRPQAHDIIRTWAFYTLLKSELHFAALPWRDVLISGWGLAGEGMAKISKSRGGGPAAPLEMIQRTSADALRYWAASTGPGKDAVINEEKIQMGLRLATKLWNVARFAEPFLTGQGMLERPADGLTAADCWILAELNAAIRAATAALETYEYAQAKSAAENFFWAGLADNYLEMAKQRLYSGEGPGYAAARFTIQTVLRGVVKLFATFLPYVTEAVYLELFAATEGCRSVHRSAWPEPEEFPAEEYALNAGRRLVAVLSAARRFKTERKIGLASALKRLQLGTLDPDLAELLRRAEADLISAARAEKVEILTTVDPDLTVLYADDRVTAAIEI
jgi:valyl-tRNA synthetase